MTLAPNAPNIFLSIEIGLFFPAKHMANNDVSDPPRCADSKNPIFFLFLAEFWVQHTSQARRSVSVGFFLGGGGLARGQGS